MGRSKSFEDRSHDILFRTVIRRKGGCSVNLLERGELKYEKSDMFKCEKRPTQELFKNGRNEKKVLCIIEKRLRFR